MANKYIANDTDLQAVANAIREKGGTSSPLTFPDGFVEAIGDIQTGGGDSPSASPKVVNFIDYDGTVLYSYTEADALTLTALPANPSHSGLTSQGWNWTLAQIKAQLTSMPGAPAWVGQKYITNDGKTRIYCHFETGRLEPYLGLGIDGTVEVDWGDDSSTDTLTGTSLTAVTTAQHVYSNAGDYIITLTVSNGKFEFFGVSNTAHILKKSADTAQYISRVYSSAVQRVEMGANVNIGDYAFYNCYSLASITIPDGVTNIGSNAFNNCYSLASITIPDSVTSISSYAFNNCYSLASITIPNGVTSISAYAFYSCFSLASITIPNGVTSISTYAFYSCYSLASITIPDSVTNIGGSAFYNCCSLASIMISDGVTSISSYVFYNCFSLASITIPDSVTSIGGSVFYNCYGLGEIHFLPTTPPTVSFSNAFTKVQTDCKIYVPAGSLAAYTRATNYPNSSTYTYIEE